MHVCVCVCVCVCVYVYVYVYVCVCVHVQTIVPRFSLSISSSQVGAEDKSLEGVKKKGRQESNVDTDPHSPSVCRSTQGVSGDSAPVKATWGEEWRLALGNFNNS